MDKQTESRLLKLLRDAADRRLSGEELSRRLGVSRNAVWKHVVSLRQAGYGIEAAPRAGYRFKSAPDRVLPDEIHHRLSASVIGRQVLAFESLDSTNRLAMEMGHKGSREGLVIFAEEQTKGRGRLGRVWASPKGKGLYFSVLLRPVLAVDQLPKITLMAAVAALEAVRETTRVRAKIRWPNDLLVEGKKLCGILTEMDAESDRIQFVVLGVGINVNTSKRQLPENATSLKEETGSAQDRCALAARVLERIEFHYKKLLAGKFRDVVELWESHSAITGRRVTVATVRGSVEGEAMGIDDDGALWVRQPSGVRTRILSGDIVKLR